jgi:SagB-type dehydrogenase family enzyme
MPDMLSPQQPSAAQGALDRVRAYHERSKHRLQRYSAGPETLDWDAQPDPFRRWAGAPLLPLPLVADALPARWGELAAGVPAHAPGMQALGALFELSFALTGWKQDGPDRWALRANPSSGNLHPTEAYLVAINVPGLGDGVYHYAPLEHALEWRFHADPADAASPPQLWIGLSSVQWREAWKYGERAFRYCQLDTGHALGAVRYAAATLGWQARVVQGIGHDALAALLGLDREADFGRAEAEEPELLIQIGPRRAGPAARPAWTSGQWHGQANLLDARPMYRWPVIAEVAHASREPAGEPADIANDIVANTAPPSTHATLAAATLIRQRRSARQFDRCARMPVTAFMRMSAALMPAAGLPWDCWPHTPRVHAVFHVHRVEGLAPGVYALPRSTAGAAAMSAALHNGVPWQAVPDAPAGLPLQHIGSHAALAGALRTLSCHQAIASDACFALSLLAEFDATLDDAPWRYRSLFQEAGLAGHVLYLQAEAEGYRGTGIGCYFDDAAHELLGLADTRLQVLYHFTVGQPVIDLRLDIEAPYAGRTPVPATNGNAHD